MRVHHLVRVATLALASLASACSGVGFGVGFGVPIGGRGGVSVGMGGTVALPRPVEPAASAASAASAAQP